MKHIIIVLTAFLSASVANALTKEEIQKIEESNKRALEASIQKSEPTVSPSSDVEDEPVTDEQFKAVQKQQKTEDKKKVAKTPTILASTAYLRSPKDHVGKKFRIMMMGENMIGFGCQKKPKPSCDWNYLIGDDGGFGAMVGDGFYSFECSDKKVCMPLEEVAGQETATRTVEVEMINVVEFVDKQGRKRQVPLFKALKIE